MKKILVAGLATGLMMFAMIGVANAFLINFENGVDGARVDDIAGISFLNYGGFAPNYLDGRTGTYNVNDANGSYDHGDYQIVGNFGIWAGMAADAQGVKIDFTNNDGTWFKTGYSANSNFFLDAYLTDGTMVQVSGGNNYGGNINYLTATATAGRFIDYVVIHDTGNYWVADEMSGDATGVNNVPEPATMLLFGTGIAGLAAVGRRKRS